MSVTYWASINNLPDKSRSSAGRTVHEGHGNRNGTDEVIRTDNGSNQSHLLCPVLLLLFITEIILLLTLLYSSLLYSSLLYWFSLAFPPLLVGVSALRTTLSEHPRFCIVFVVYSPLLFHACQRLVRPLFFHDSYPFRRTSTFN